MKEKILRLCKRLNKFSADELETISETPAEELLPILDELVKENKLINEGDFYFYNKAITTSNRVSKLPMMFQYHNRERIDLIIRAFCCECSTEHMSKILNLGVNCVNDFCRFFREIIYSKQAKELDFHFQKAAQKPYERVFFDKKYYFYNYDNKIFVSDVKLKKNDTEPLNYGEQKYFKIIYSRLRRRISHNTHAYYTAFHLSDQIWRQEKSFEKLYDEMNYLLYS